jgi:hypothetical protein
MFKIINVEKSQNCINNLTIPYGSLDSLCAYMCGCVERVYLLVNKECYIRINLNLLIVKQLDIKLCNNLEFKVNKAMK